MGFLDRFRKRRSNEKPESSPDLESAEEAGAEVPKHAREAPTLVAVARSGMSAPAEDYVLGVLEHAFPAGLQWDVVKVGLSQPRWPSTPALLDSSVAALQSALAREHAIETARSTYLEAKGPDGAKVLIVAIWGNSRTVV